MQSHCRRDGLRDTANTSRPQSSLFPQSAACLPMGRHVDNVTRFSQSHAKGSHSSPCFRSGKTHEGTRPKIAAGYAQGSGMAPLSPHGHPPPPPGSGVACQGVQEAGVTLGGLGLCSEVASSSAGVWLRRSLGPGGGVVQVFLRSFGGASFWAQNDSLRVSAALPRGPAAALQY